MADTQRGKSTITLQDVARQAGVSPMTVSNVINAKTGVRPVTRQRVLDAVASTGYRVNPMARALAGGRSRLISVFAPQLNKLYAAEVVHGAAQAAEVLNYDLVVMMLGESTASDLSVMTRMSVGALLIQPSQQRLWWRTDLPTHVVSVDGPGERPFTVDNFGGACLATRHLIELGHTHIGFISGLLDEDRVSGGNKPGPVQYDRDDADERFRGYQTSMAQAGLDIPRGYVQHGDYTKASGEAAARKLLDLKTPPTAVFVSGDAMALGAMHVAQDRGLEVPGDLSVVGFDDLPIAAASRPGLSTVRQPLRLMGEAAVKMLVALADGHNPPLPPPFLTELIRRESAAPPKDH
ncbi:LacI family DNA-binding transcriptional regulator [Deinococcus sp.]|uniref:LacI family DNA-binding transcriptional regulator n=1 Tax=Deinococcus sp. TaxID=47478 RepID=UPI0025FF8366|nr:LacI family DNA-binding transcriptional regulator [Deinococcus sp.]